MATLRIGINALYMIPGGVGGTEIYLRSLIAALDRVHSPHEFLVYINAETETTLEAPSARFKIIATGIRAVNRPRRLAWEQLELPRRLRRDRIDVLFNPGFTSPWRSPCPTVTVFHDLQHKRHPEYFRWFDLPAWQAFLSIAGRRSTLILAVSEVTRQDVLSHYRLDPSRVRVVHHGVDTEFFGIRERRPAHTDERYILTVSTLHPHKNFPRLLSAYAEFAGKRSGWNLVIAGLRGFDAGFVDQRIGELQLAGKVRSTGWIPREELYDLYAGAGAFVYPTTFEGFGMTLLEAMAAGLPVACSDIEPLRTLAGNAALLFDPNKTEEIVNALVSITKDAELRRSLQEAGPVRARNFSWQETARLTLALLEEAAASRR
ncbi:MAG TPA: glycosyltransferase family 1 protein [Bryobacteraceae bacterium]|jgi:glycosyltransferase involved in cell wall biosynthesis